jgi:proline reductase-associated electron transfer protein PrdC
MAERFQFYLKQHIGVPSVPVIAKGDRVQRGQLIARKECDSLGANIFTSVSGVVEDLTEDKVVILADEQQTEEYVSLKSEEPLSLIEQAGIVGLGGAGFPTYVKLSKPFQTDGIVIVNAAECEPILSHNMKRIEEYPEQLIQGLEIVMKIVHASEGAIAIKAKHDKAISCMTKEIEKTKEIGGSKIRVALLPDMYPMGEERAIIREVLGPVLSVNSLPMEANAIVINAETVCRIWEAVTLKKPLIDKDLTVAGKIKGNEEAKLIQTFLNVPLGKSVENVFAMAGGVATGYGEIIMGGPFTGKRTTLGEPISKTTGGLIATECFMKGPEKIGLLVCACGADKERLEQIAQSMGSKVVGVEYCKQAKEVKETRKCENPGRCPGQVQKVMALKKAGAEAVLISNCTDCSNTVMSCAPKMGLPVYHCTDGALRAVNIPLIRAIKK